MSCLVDPVTCSAPTTGTAGTIFASALQFFAVSQCLISENWPPDANSNNGTHYDIVIAGAGSAGAVLASRLSEIPTLSVLLLEVGDDPPQESMIPSNLGLYFTKYDWQYKTEDNGRTNQASVNGSFYWAKGKMLGGSSGINSMLYFEGNPYDYERWYQLGNEEWRPDIVQNYSKKAENLQNLELLNDPEITKVYGHNGPLVINRFNSTYRPLTEDILRAWEEIGIKTVKDLNAANNLGAGIFSVTAANGRRQDTATTYLVNVQGRKNLHIMKNSLVTKVLINPLTKEAYGVEVERNGEKLIFYADKEVILSAGSVGSPQLLMLSGVGPEADLKKVNIEPIIDLPGVGKNLQDHTDIPITIYADDYSSEDEAAKHFDEIKYLFNKTGYLAQNNFLLDISAFYSTDKNAQWPDFQILLNTYHKNSTTAIRGSFQSVQRYKSEVIESIVTQYKDKALYLFALVLLHPYSRGQISLQSNNIKDQPLLNPNYYSDARDLDKTVEGIKMMTKLVNTTYFKSIGGKLGRINWGPCNSFELDSTEYWKCIALDMSTTIFHAVGTTQMDPDPSKAVVDSRMRVHGVKKLSVVDAGVMPTLTSCNTNGPTIMIAERASDLIKEDLLLHY